MTFCYTADNHGQYNETNFVDRIVALVFAISCQATCLATFGKKKKTLEPFLDLCVSSLRRGHANLLCIVPILSDVRRHDIGQTTHIYTVFSPRIYSYGQNFNFPKTIYTPHYSSPCICSRSSEMPRDKVSGKFLESCSTYCTSCSTAVPQIMQYSSTVIFASCVL